MSAAATQGGEKEEEEEEEEENNPSDANSVILTIYCCRFYNLYVKESQAVTF
jgi:hypothetical protein